MAGILVIAEAQEGALAPISAELLGAARKLAVKAAHRTALVAGSEALAKSSSRSAPMPHRRHPIRPRRGTADAYVPAVEAPSPSAAPTSSSSARRAWTRPRPALAFKFTHRRRHGLR